VYYSDSFVAFKSMYCVSKKEKDENAFIFSSGVFIFWSENERKKKWDMKEICSSSCVCNFAPQCN